MDLFNALLSFATSFLVPWVIGGDFNCVMWPSEKMGGAIPALAPMTEFNVFACSAGLLDVGCTGLGMTLSNNRTGSTNIRARLDRIFINSQCQSVMPHLLVKHLPRGPSDHAPMLLFSDNFSSGPSRFIFQKMLISHNSFVRVVSQAWDQNHDHPNAMVRLSNKLKVVKNYLCKWNKEVFGDVTKNIILARMDLGLK